MLTVLSIIRKETLQVLRDRIMLIQIVLPPILQLLILAQAMTFEVKHTDLALIDLDHSAASERLVTRILASGRFEVAVRSASAEVADEALLARKAGAVLRIPEGFGRDLQRGEPPTIQLILNAEDGAAAGIIQSYVAQILAAFSAGESGAAVGARPASAPNRPGLTIQTRTFYNPQREYIGYMAIGLLASLVTLIGILLTSQNIAREKEIGTLEQLNVTPITRTQFIAGKLAPFWVLGLLELTVGLLLIRFAFGITYEGSLFLVYLAAAVYLFAALGLGLLISTIVETQQQAQFVTFFVVVTMFMLGGIFTPAQSMPAWAQIVADLNPIKHFASILRSVLMKGGSLGDIAAPIGAMGLFAAAVLTLALFRYRKTAA